MGTSPAQPPQGFPGPPRRATVKKHLRDGFGKGQVAFHARLEHEWYGTAIVTPPPNIDLPFSSPLPASYLLQRIELFDNYVQQISMV